MAEVLARFLEIVVDEQGTRYTAQICGAAMPDGRWEAWIEFIPLTGGTPLRTPRETTQPDSAAAQHWATGLTPTYLEGAFERALSRPTVTVQPPPEPVFGTPAPDVVISEAEGIPVDPVLDPFSVYAKGEDLLRRQLGALSERHLANIILAYGLSSEPLTVLNQLSHATLIDLIVENVRRRVSGREP